MEVIKVHHPLLEQQVPDGPVVVAMGFFDGVHRGHQAVIARAKEEAVRRQVPLAVLTYEKLPGIVYQRYEEGVHYLTTIDRKLALLEQLGADLVYLVDFTAKLGSLSPEEFVSDYLVRMHAVAVVAGFDHTYGKKDVATMDRLAGYAAGRFDVVTVKKQETRGAKIGSSRIRDLIDQGRVEDANQLLGYRYQTSGIVVHGLARGRTIGFPTANVAWNPLERIPAVGVYTVNFLVVGHWYGGMASVGYNVTFGQNKHKTIEVYLFDFKGNIYGEHVTVSWIQRLRGEIKFDGVDGLIDQLHADQINSLAILRNPPTLPAGPLN